MYKPLSTVFYVGGAIVLLIVSPIIALTAFRLARMFLFSDTLDGRLIALILLIALLPAAIGAFLFAYFLYHQIRRSFTSGAVGERDYIGRFLESRIPKDNP